MYSADVDCRRRLCVFIKQFHILIASHDFQPVFIGTRTDKCWTSEFRCDYLLSVDTYPSPRRVVYEKKIELRQAA